MCIILYCAKQHAIVGLLMPGGGNESFVVPGDTRGKVSTKFGCGPEFCYEYRFAYANLEHEFHVRECLCIFLEIQLLI